MNQIKRTFILGDDWFYIKIYTGFKTADDILIKCIYPLSEQLLENNIIDKWFFIRYGDPKFHLRIRFHINDINKINTIILSLNKSIKQYIDNGLVWKIQVDTYNREIERYGDLTMELSETLFYYDSEMICNIIYNEVMVQDENIRWLLGLKALDALLDDFDLKLDKKCSLLNKLQDNFGKEFGINNDYRRQFGQKYRILKSQIEDILKKEDNKNINQLISPIINKSTKSKEIITSIKVKINENKHLDLENLLGSYIHMMLNRLFRTQQRAHELVLYDYLFRYYNSLQARSGGIVLGTRTYTSK